MRSFTTHIDTNNNKKNNIYQIIIGGNDVKTISNIIIEIGLLPKATVVPVEFWSVKDFQYDLLILQLNSAKIVASVLSTEKIEPDSYTDLAISILFDLVHLYYVN